jgi:hypothetical protein
MKIVFSLPALTLALTLSALAPANAAMAPISVTGFNRDVVIENTASGPPYTGAALNFNAGENNVFYQTNLPGKAHGLPLSGAFTNPIDGTILQFQPYTAANVLDLSSDTGLTNGTLFLTAPKIYDRLAIIAHSGNGDATGTASLVLHFNDGTTFTTNYYAPDWFNNSNGVLYAIALQGTERIDLTSGNVSGAPSNPRFYQTTITLTNVPGATNKWLSSLTFGKGISGSGVAARSTGIYAISGQTNAAQTSLTFTAATLTNLPATSVTFTSVVLNAKVLTTGNDAPLVTLFYGTSDGGTNPAAWANSVSAGWQTGSVAQAVSGLAVATTYYFSARGVNAGGTNWASPSRSFTTLTPSPPVVTNLPATAIQANSAALNGQVLSTGGDAPAITIYYGPANGGANAAAWSNSLSLGVKGGVFAQGAFGLSSNTTYFFTAKAVNGGGTTWAAPSRSFTTLATNTPGPIVAVLTHHNDNGRTGRNLNEAILNIGNVNTNTFGLLYTRPVDDQIYAQPLIATNISIPGKGVHNLVIVATVNDSVYAFDADDATVTAAYWQTNFLDANSVVPANTDMTGACGGNYIDFSGRIGIVGTPVIDPTTGTIYLVARTIELGTFVQRLHALDITTGAERLAPVVISGTFSAATFDPQRNNQRPALTLANGNIYIAWSSHCDWGPYSGWVMSYDASTLAQVAVYCDTPTGSQGGIWMSGQGLNADSSGNVYLSTGNGTVDTSGTVNRGQSFLKLDGSTLNVLSWFTPGNYVYLNNGDYDLGSGGLLLIPGTTLALGGGKSGGSVSSPLYLVSRDNMGGLSAITTDTNIVQEFGVTPTGYLNHIHGAPVWWDGTEGSYAYVWGESDRLHQYRFDTVNGVFFLPVYSQSPTPAWVNGMTGGMLAISANGTNAGTGILWGSHQFTGNANQAVRPGILHAYDAQNVTNELWNSEQFSARDSIGTYAKFVPPTVANSKVYMATFSGRLNVYGLFPSGPPVLYVQPQSTLRFTGQPVTFVSFAAGTAPVRYQWYKGASPIPGATNANLTLSNLQWSNAATYSVRITNSVSYTISSNATLSVVSSPTISYAQTVLADNPVAYWRLNETNDIVAHDSVGGHDGQYINATQGLAGYNPNDPDTAAGFGPSTDSHVGNISGIDFGTFANNAAFSVEAWVNGGTQTSGAGIVTYGYGNGGEQFNLDTGSGSNNFRFSVRDAVNVAHNANGTLAPNNTWQHVVGVCDEANGATHLYINGVSNANATISAGVQAGTSPISIGSRQANFSSTYTMNFVGSIDEVALYNYALSAAQVLHHYQAGTNPVVTIYAQNTGPNVTLIWSPGTLQFATNAAGPYADISTATAPYVIPPSGARQFFRVRVR